MTPQDVRELSLTGLFNSLSDAQIQKRIDLVACWYGAPNLAEYSQQCDAIAYGTAHLLYVQIKAEEAQGPNALLPYTGNTLVDVGSFSWAIGGFGPDNLLVFDDIWSPFIATLREIIAAFAPAITTTNAPRSADALTSFFPLGYLL